MLGPCQPAQPPLHPASLQARRAREDFLYMLKHMRDVKADTSFEAATELCRGEPEWEGLSSEEERRRLFEEHVEKLKVRGGRRGLGRRHALIRRQRHARC